MIRMILLKFGSCCHDLWKPAVSVNTFWPAFRWIWEIFGGLPRAVLQLCQQPPPRCGTRANSDRSEHTRVRSGKIYHSSRQAITNINRVLHFCSKHVAHFVNCAGRPRGAAPLPVSGQRHPLVPQGDSGSCGHHGGAQRLLHMSQLLRGGVRVPAAHRGGQPGRRHQSLLLHGHSLHRWVCARMHLTNQRARLERTGNVPFL